MITYLIRGAILLACAMASCVGVAWTCLARSALNAPISVPPEVWMHDPASGWSAVENACERRKGMGVQITMGATGIGSSSVPPLLARNQRSLGEGTLRSEWALLFVQVDAGWPFLALSANDTVFVPAPTRPLWPPLLLRQSGMNERVVHLLDTVFRPDRPLCLPYRVRWWGAGANVAVMATCIWLVVATMRSLRRRAVGWYRCRRGWCAVCGYPQGAGHTPCSECGTSAPMLSGAELPRGSGLS